MILKLLYTDASALLETNPLVKYFPNRDHYLARSLDVSGRANEVEKIWPILLQSIKEIEGNKVFGTEEDFLKNLIAELPASSVEKTNSSLRSR